MMMYFKAFILIFSAAVHSTQGQEACTDFEDPLSGLEPGFWNASRVEFGANGRDGKLVPVDLANHPFNNAFYEGDSYLIQFSKQEGGKPVVLYYWQGVSSDTFERGASAILTVQLDDQIGGAAKQARVEMGEEPQHFLDLFDGTFVTLLGGLKKAELKESSGDTKLFKVSGKCNKANTESPVDLVRTNEVKAEADLLDESEVYIYLLDNQVTIYEPKEGASAVEKATADKVVESIASKQDKQVISDWNQFKALLA